MLILSTNFTVVIPLAWFLHPTRYMKMGYNFISKSEKNHTLKLLEHLYSLNDDINSHSQQGKFVDIQLEGPYGIPTLNFHDDDIYEVFLFFAGGIGGTPLYSIFM